MNITKIYLVTNCYGDSNKVYLGKEKSHKSRSRYIDHKIKFGKDIIFTYIDEVKGWDIKDWKPLECFWIEYFKFLGFDIQNKNKGGCGPSFQTNKTKNKISKSSKYKNSKSIIQYDLKGNFIKEWKSISECCHINKFSPNNISMCCKKHTHQAHGFIWKFKKDNSDIIIKWKRKRKRTLPVLQYNLDGILLKEWKSTHEISNILNIKYNSINECLNGRTKSSGGYKWKYK
jgi:hypothetical protein